MVFLYKNGFKIKCLKIFIWFNYFNVICECMKVKEKRSLYYCLLFEKIYNKINCSLNVY